MTLHNYDFPESGIHRYVARHIRALGNLEGKVVLDIPCGDGRSSYEFLNKGAKVIALDLFPEFLKLKDQEAQYADMAEILPLENESVDYIICQEGIEHIPNQLSLLEEFNRVLKKDGVLLITTPNYSHTRARLSHFLLESDLWKRMPPTEIDSIWFAEGKSDKLYFGHLFLLGVQHFNSLLTFSGFEVRKRIKTDLGNTSLILSLLLYPFLTLFTLLSFIGYRRKNKHVEKTTRNNILWERVKLNLSPTTLFYKHIFWEVSKVNSLDETKARLKAMHRL